MLAMSTILYHMHIYTVLNASRRAVTGRVHTLVVLLHPGQTHDSGVSGHGYPVFLP